MARHFKLVEKAKADGTFKFRILIHHVGEFLARFRIYIHGAPVVICNSLSVSYLWLVVTVSQITARTANVSLNGDRHALERKGNQRLVANMMISLVAANLAMHTTAPNKAATTLLLVITDPGLIASTAAEQATAVKSSWCSVAGTAFGAENSKSAK